MLRQLTTAVCTLALSAAAVVAITSPAEAANKQYKNCTALNKDYKHGVGKPGAKDKTSSVPVTTFTRNAAIYKKNTKSDRDKDGIACEKR